jgi:EmrB/QacA subfamily drug resistance transporter
MPGHIRGHARDDGQRGRSVIAAIQAVPDPAASSELSLRRWRVLVIASIGVFLATLDASVLAVALPVISSDLKLSFSEALWVQASYLVIVTILLIPVGRWSERHGHFFAYWLGNLLFGLFSLVGALAWNGSFLIGARVLQAVGGSLIITTSAAIVTAVFPPAERGRALGLNMMASTLGQTCGPPLGGLIVAHLGWQWIFYIKVPVAMIAVVAGWDLLGAERRDRAASPRPQSEGNRDIDLPGAGLLGLLLASLFVPLIFSPLWGWGSARTIVPLTLVGFFVAAFVVRETRTPLPIIDLSLFRRSRAFSAANASSMLYMASSYGVTIFTAVFLEVVQGRSVQTTGLILLVQPGVMTLVTPLAGRLSDRLGSRGLSAAGMLVVAVGTVQLALFTVSSPTWQVLAGLVALGLGLGIFSAPNFSTIMGSVDRSRLGLASGLFTTTRFCGMGISIAILGAIAASKLGAEGGRVILLGARASVSSATVFAAGYREAMLVGTGIAVVGAIVSLVRERRGTPR